ncbi:MAG: hypothetical protein ABFD92_11090 [Planctomycetaceae bacterium]|nr:hypothetical protein [Planctomycetaceae bacterium]
MAGKFDECPECRTRVLVPAAAAKAAQSNPYAMPRVGAAAPPPAAAPAPRRPAVIPVQQVSPAQPQSDLDRLRMQQEARAQREKEDRAAIRWGSGQRGIDKGVWGGLAMMVGAVVWFVVGWMAGYIFFYPPILFVIGIVALVRGLADRR